MERRAPTRGAPIQPPRGGPGHAFGFLAGGVAIGGYTARVAVIAGLVIALIGIPTAWAASFLRPPTNREDTHPASAELAVSHV